MSLRLLLILSGGLEILAGLPALISPAPVVSLLLGVPVDWIAGVVARLFGAGVLALGLACLKARGHVRIPADLAVSIGITSYNVLVAGAIFWTATGSGLGGLLLWKAGLSMRFSACYSCPSLRERDDNRAERGRSTRLLV